MMSLSNKSQIILKPILILLCVVFLDTSTMAQVSLDWPHKKELYNLLQSLADTIYIQDRGALEELVGSTCTTSEVRYYSASNSSELFQILIKTKAFLPSLHLMQLTDTMYALHHGKKKIDSIQYKNWIDSTYAYGICGDKPKHEFATFIILRGFSKVEIPKSAYSDLYNIHLCENNKAPEAYITLDNKYLYIYLNGGEGENAYAVKLIFDDTKYLIRVINTYPCLKDFDFIDGFGECE